jgi:hypothetical protein
MAPITETLSRWRRRFDRTTHPETTPEERRLATSDCIRLKWPLPDSGRIFLTSKRLIYQRAAHLYTRWGSPPRPVVIAIDSISSVSERSRAMRLLTVGWGWPVFRVKLASGTSYTFQASPDFYQELVTFIERGNWIG